MNNSNEKKAKGFIKAFQKNVDESIVLSYCEELNSHETSIEDLGETAKINLPKHIKSPKNMKAIKQKSSRLVTEEENK